MSRTARTDDIPEIVYDSLYGDEIQMELREPQTTSEEVVRGKVHDDRVLLTPLRTNDESCSVREQVNKKKVVISKGYAMLKRCFDILFSVILGVFALPILLSVCLIILIKDGRNPFYTQVRVGIDGKKFHIVKLRSMKKGADDVQNMLDERQLQQYYSEYKLEDDPRLIGWKKPGDSNRCFGSWIRKLSIDELPQIYWNILIKGNMSVIGPRPILQEELVKNYTPEERKMLLSIKPGLTGYWQAYARNNATYDTGERQRMELYYVQHQCVWLDIKILFATVGAILTKSGAK